MRTVLLYFLILSLIGVLNWLIYFIILRKIKSKDEKIKNLSEFIKFGVKTYQKRQYILILKALILALLFFVHYAIYREIIAFIAGIIFPLMIGLVNVTSSLLSGEKLAQAFSSKEKDRNVLSLHFTAGMLPAVWLLASLSIGVGFLFYLFQAAYINLNQIIYFSLGVCFFTLLSRSTGGLPGEAAESEIDLISQQNPKMKNKQAIELLNIVTYLRYHINGVVGRGTDYVGSIILSIASALILSNFMPGDRLEWMLLPVLLLIGGFISVLISAYGLKIITGKTWKSNSIIFPTLTLIIFLVISFFLVKELKLPYTYLWSIIIGIVLGFSFILISLYYVKGRAVRGIAEASKTGAATNLITGLAAGMRSTALPVLLLGGAIYESCLLGGFYGISLTAVTLCSILAMASALNGWGSIGLAGLKMADEFKSTNASFSQEVYKNNFLSISIGRGLSIAAASLACFSLFGAFIYFGNIHVIDIIKAEIVIGTFIGAIIPLLVASFAIIAVVNISQDLKPLTCISTAESDQSQDDKNSLLHQIIKSIHSFSRREVLFFILLPIIVLYFYYLWFGSRHNIAGILVGIMFMGILLALFLNFGGTSWESSYYYLKQRILKKEDETPYKASLVGRLVGNPLQNIAGPLMNVLIKFIPLFAITLLLINLS